MLTPFSEDDLQAAAQLFVRVFNAPPWNDAWTPATARKRLADLLATPGSAGVCLRRDGSLIAFAPGHCEQWSSGRHFLLKQMCVDTGLQRQGHGGALLTALVEGLDDVEQVYLLTASTSAASGFYQGKGFTFAHGLGVVVKQVHAAQPPTAASDGTTSGATTGRPGW